jgi:hypothetical protein
MRMEWSSKRCGEMAHSLECDDSVRDVVAHLRMLRLSCFPYNVNLDF